MIDVSTRDVVPTSDAMFHVESECGHEGLIEFTNRYLRPVRTVNWETVLTFEGDWQDNNLPKPEYGI